MQCVAALSAAFRLLHLWGQYSCVVCRGWRFAFVGGVGAAYRSEDVEGGSLELTAGISLKGGRIPEGGIGC